MGPKKLSNSLAYVLIILCINYVTDFIEKLSPYELIYWKGLAEAHVVIFLALVLSAITFVLVDTVAKFLRIDFTIGHRMFLWIISVILYLMLINYLWTILLGKGIAAGGYVYVFYFMIYNIILVFMFFLLD